MKKLFIIVLSMVLAAVYLTVNCFDNRHRYSEEEKKPLPDYSLGDSAYPVTNYFSYAVDKADLIVEGEIIDITLPGFTNWVTIYTLKIDRIWFGTYEGDTLTLQLDGGRKYGPPKLYLYDQGVFLLKLRPEGNSYMLSASEDSIFIKNPPSNRIFSLSSNQDTRAFDGKSVLKLKKAMEKEL